MRNLTFIVVVLAAIITIVLYLQRMNKVPADVQKTLGDSVQTMQQIPDAVRRRVANDYEKSRKRTEDATSELER